MSDAAFYESRNTVALSAELETVQAGLVVFVAGGCRGIGLQIVIKIREALESHPFAHQTTVFITSRNLSAAQQALTDKLHLTGQTKYLLNIVPLALDITDQDSIDKAKQVVMETCDGRIDILFNNAGFAYKMADVTPFPEQAQVTTNINYNGTKNVITTLLPCLEKSVLPNGARVINVSSTSGQLGSRYSEEVRLSWLAAKTVLDVDGIVQRFVVAAQNGKHIEQGYPNSAYSVSKTAVTQLTRVLSASFPKINFYACCPGLCRTEMAGGEWTTWMSVLFWAATWVVGHSAYAGADTPVWLALADIGPSDASESSSREPHSGKFFRSRTVQDY